MQTLRGNANRFELTVICGGTTYYESYTDVLFKTELINYLVRQCGISKNAAKLFADKAILKESPIRLRLKSNIVQMDTKNGCFIELKDASDRTFYFYEN